MDIQGRCREQCAQNNPSRQGIFQQESYRPAFLCEKGESGNYGVVFGRGYSVKVWYDSLGDLFAGVENRDTEAQGGAEGLLLQISL